MLHVPCIHPPALRRVCGSQVPACAVMHARCTSPASTHLRGQWQQGSAELQCGAQGAEQQREGEGEGQAVGLQAPACEGHRDKAPRGQQLVEEGDVGLRGRGVGRERNG